MNSKIKKCKCNSDKTEKKKENLKKIKQEIYSSSPHPKNKKKMNLKYFKLPYNSQKFLIIKNQNIKKLSDEILNEQGVTFKPKLNDHVNSMIKKKFLQRSSDFQKTREIKLNIINIKVKLILRH